MSFKKTIYSTASEVATDTKVLQAGTAPTKWERNPLWPALAMPADNTFVGLFAVFDGQDNLFAVSATVSSGTVSINLGDGTSTTFASGTQFNYNYSYSDPDLYYDPGLPYKIAIVQINPTTGGATLNSLSASPKHNQSGLQNGYTVNWLEIKAKATTTQPFNSFSSSAGVGPVASLLENVEVDTSTFASASGLFNSTARALARASITFRTNSTFSINSLFASCTRLIEPELVFAGTGRPSDCGGLFNGCRLLQYVPLFDTSACTAMNNMFAGCTTLLTVPLFNTAAVTNMTSMFNGCALLQEVPLFNTAACTSMASMFALCSALRTVPLFNTASVTSMNSMFSSCTALTSVPLFNTAAVTNMGNMFFTCTSLTTVPLFNTAACTNMSTMFQACGSLKEVPLFNTAAVTNMANMFANCVSLTSVPLFNTAAVTNMTSFLSGCVLLTSVPLFNLTAATNVTSMFNGCTGLTSVPAMNFNAASSASNLTTPFASCRLFRIRVTGARFTHTIASNCLSGAALDEYYTGLPTVTAQTLTVTGNYGTTSDNPSIATLKGWTVTGS